MARKIIMLAILIISMKIYKAYTNGLKEDDFLHRNKRQLLFLNQSFFQFNAGVGAPTASKMVNVNWAIQAQFTLPWNRTQIPVDILEANSGYTGTARGKREAKESKLPAKKDYENDAKLYHFYKYIEDVLNGYGYDGTTCTLRMLCELGGEPLHTDVEEDLLHEIASFVMNPTNDIQDGSSPADSHAYIQAHTHGHDQKDCHKLYKGCELSVVDMFSFKSPVTLENK